MPVYGSRWRKLVYASRFLTRLKPVNTACQHKLANPDFHEFHAACRSTASGASPQSGIQTLDPAEFRPKGCFRSQLRLLSSPQMRSQLSLLPGSWLLQIRIFLFFPGSALRPGCRKGPTSGPWLRLRLPHRAPAPTPPPGSGSDSPTGFQLRLDHTPITLPVYRHLRLWLLFRSHPQLGIHLPTYGNSPNPNALRQMSP